MYAAQTNRNANEMCQPAEWFRRRRAKKKGLTRANC